MPDAETTTATAPATVRMTQEKQCTGSIRYAVDESKKKDALVSNVYLSRNFAPVMPKAINVAVTPAD